MSVRTIDLFCGAGGSSWGAKNAGCEIIAGFDLNPVAGEAFMANHPDAWFYESKLEELNPIQIRKELGPIDLILASPECTNHSPAKGSAPRCEKSKETAFQVTRFAKAFKPRWIVIENVVNMRKWHRYDEFHTRLEKLGYHIREQVLNAADFGVPQSRRRLFLMCDLKKEPLEVIPKKGVPKTVRQIIDSNGTYPYTPLRRKGRAEATLARADRAIAALGDDEPFLIVYYGSDAAGGWQHLDRPLRTITTIDRFAYVKPTEKGHMMRMLQVPELRKAMGIPASFLFKHGTRRDQIKMLGNAVCSPVMCATIRELSSYV